MNTGNPAKRPTRLEPLGDRAFLAHFSSERAAGDWAAAVRRRQRAGVRDVVVAFCTVAVFVDPEDADLDDTESFLLAVDPTEAARRDGRRVVIPVLYDGADLADVAARMGLTADEVIRLHSQVEYLVFAIGFLPGFPYAGPLPAPLAGLPRRASPRLRVPRGSVAIVGRQTAIYPAESPGGWHLLGRTPVAIVDVEAGYFPLRAGDQIQFEPISVSEFEAGRHDRLA